MNYDLILHLDSKDPEMFRLVARNANNYLNALPEAQFQLHVVANGAGATLFTGHADLHELAAALMKRDVRFKVCANALREHEIPFESIWQGCEIVPAGLVEIVHLQRKGFAYIKP